MIFQRKIKSTSETRETCTGNLATLSLIALCWFSSYIYHLEEKKPNRGKKPSKVKNPNSNKDHKEWEYKKRKGGKNEKRERKKNRTKILLNKIPIAESIPAWTRVLDSCLSHASSTKLSVAKGALQDPLFWQWLNDRRTWLDFHIPTCSCTTGSQGEKKLKLCFDLNQAHLI